MSDDAGLFPAPKKKRSFGPVYQGVAKQIRTLTESEQLDPDQFAGTIAAARALGSSIDRASGHPDYLSQASGMQLAALHSELRELLAVLSPETAASDPFQELLDKMNNETGVTTSDDNTEAPHTQG